MVNADQTIDLDSIFLELGHFGKFQLKTYILMSIPIFASALYTISYVFTTANPPYRCLVPECEDKLDTVYQPEWLSNAIKFEEGAPARCRRYSPHELNKTFAPEETCPADWFDDQIEVKCNDYVFGTEHTSIANDFDIICHEHWKLTLPGSIHNLGQFISMFVTGIISDKFGRRFAMTAGLLASAIFGLLRSFAPFYWWFVVFEFLDAMFGAAAYASAFILATELVSPNKRVLIATIVCSAYALGEAVIGVLAWHVMSWRWLLRISYAPGLLLVVYFWISPESVRWLISKGKLKEVEIFLKDAAKQNGVTLSDKAIAMIEFHNSPSNTEANKSTEKENYPLRAVVKNVGLLLRVINCSFCWITCVFVFYGLSLNSVEIAGNMYMNFILVSLVEIPGYMASYICLDRFGRRSSLCGSFILSGAACFSFIFIDPEQTTLRLILFMLGKCSITMSFAIIYVYTAELFPTPLRQTLLGICSMFGRIGSMVAPQMPLLAVYVWSQLPIFSFGLMSVIAGFLVLLFPETLNTKLPDTIEEAMNIGKKDKLGEQA